MPLDLSNEVSAQNITIAGNTTDLTGGTIPTTFKAAGVYRISCALDTATTMVVRFTPTGGSATNFSLWSGTNFTVNAPRTCILKLPEGTSFTIRFGAACLVQFITVEQVFGGTL